MPKEYVMFTADWHLLDSQYAKGWRSDDFMRAAEFVIDEADRRGVRTIINGGDTCHTRLPSSKVVSQLMSLDARLRRKGMRMLTVTGNHDMADPTWLETLRSHSAPDRQDWENGIFPLDHRTVTLSNGVTIGGLPYMHPDELRATLATMNLPEILVWHGMVKEFVPEAFAPEGCISVDDFPTALQAVLLGDIHVCKMQIRITGNTLIGYPGTIETVRAHDQADKYIMLLAVHDDGSVTIVEQIPVPIRPYVTGLYQTEEAFSGLLQEIARMPETPVINIRCTRNIQSASERVRLVVARFGWKDPVIRVMLVSDDAGARETARRHHTSGVVGLDSMVDMQALLAQVEPVSTEAYNLMTAMLAVRSDMLPVLDNYVAGILNAVDDENASVAA